MIGNPVNTMSNPTASVPLTSLAVNFSSTFGNSLGSLGMGALISAADSTIGTLLNNAFAKRNARLLYKYWLKMFDYQADYNSPLNLLKRLYDAGINPNYNSLYGGSLSFSSLIGSLPTLVDSFLTDNLKTAASIDLLSKELDIAKSRAEAENAKDYAEVGESVANAKLTEIKSLTLLDEALALIAVLNSLKDLNDKEKEYKSALITLSLTYARKLASEVYLVKELINSTRALADYYDVQAKYVPYNSVTDRMLVYENVRHNKASEGLETQHLNFLKGQLNWDIKKDKFDLVKHIIDSANQHIAGMTIQGKKELMNKLYNVLLELTLLTPQLVEHISKIDPELGMSYLEALSKASLAAGALGGAKGLGEGLVNGAGAVIGKKLPTKALKSTGTVKGFGL